MSAAPSPHPHLAATLWMALMLLIGAWAAWPDARPAILPLLGLPLVGGIAHLPSAVVARTTMLAAALLLSATVTLWVTGWSAFAPHADGPAAAAALAALLATGTAVHRARRLHEVMQAQQAELADTQARSEVLITRDPLTGLFNQRHVHEGLLQESRRAHRNGAPLSLALLDLDHFRQINAQHGHAVGEEALVNVARLAEAVFRQTDVIARWAGDQYVVLFPDTPPDQALLALDRWRQRLQSQDLSVGHRGAYTTVSGGLVTWEDGDTVDRILQRAEEALRTAKAQGRNRVVTITTTPAATLAGH